MALPHDDETRLQRVEEILSGIFHKEGPVQREEGQTAADHLQAVLNPPADSTSTTSSSTTDETVVTDEETAPDHEVQ